MAQTRLGAATTPRAIHVHAFPMHLERMAKPTTKLEYPHPAKKLLFYTDRAKPMMLLSQWHDLGHNISKYIVHHLHLI
jgi:hypothetical protein